MFLSCPRLLKRFAAYQSTIYLETNKLFLVCQSGFRSGHSTEILLHLLSDIYGAVDSSPIMVLHSQVDGGKDKRRPTKRWMDNIMKNTKAQGMDIREATDKAMEKSTWRPTWGGSVE